MSRWFLPLFALGALAGCERGIPFTPLEDLYNLEVVATRSAYAPGDSVFVRITNHESIAFVWHRCPGLPLERKTTTGWAELEDGTCSPGSFPIPGGETLTVVFVMPPAAPGGQYRVQARLSAIDSRPPLFWWPSPEFSVSGA
jgi:hypothetical protein